VVYRKKAGDSFANAGWRTPPEARLKRLVTILALLSSLASSIVIGGIGLTLLAIESSGELGAGALLALCGGVAFAAVMALVLARHGTFGEGAWRAVAIGAAILGAVPSAGLSFAAIRFAGLPFGSRIPLADWTILGIGILFGAGAVAILALGHRRSLERADLSEEAPVVHMQQIREAQQQLRSAFSGYEPKKPVEEHDDGDIRVRRV
jgi:hypothetical protein